MQTEIPSQKKMINSIESIPVEYFAWGEYPDHFKIDMPHRHEFSELLFFTNEGGTHEIDYNNHEIKSCAIHYIPKSAVHFLNRDIHSTGFTLSFNSDYFEKNNVHKFINPLDAKPLVFNLSKSKFSFIYEQAKYILHQIKQTEGYHRQKCFLLAIELLLNTISAEQHNHVINNSLRKDSELMGNFKLKVQTNIFKHHSVSWYANQLNISSKHLGNQVKKSLGISAKQYIFDVLLMAIKRDLLDTNKTIAQIAFDYNYDGSALGKLFKKHVSYTMNEYRSYRIME